MRAVAYMGAARMRMCACAQHPHAHVHRANVTGADTLGGTGDAVVVLGTEKKALVLLPAGLTWFQWAGAKSSLQSRSCQIPPPAGGQHTRGASVAALFLAACARAWAASSAGAPHALMRALVRGCTPPHAHA